MPVMLVSQLSPAVHAGPRRDVVPKRRLALLPDPQVGSGNHHDGQDEPGSRGPVQDLV